jgi:hypothetical protein
MASHEISEGDDPRITGFRLRPLCFGFHRGSKLLGVISRSGRVYKPSPYNIPYLPYKVLAFALNLVMAMLDSRMITSEHFGSEERFICYRGLTLDLLRRIECDAMLGLSGIPKDQIEYQEH